MTARWRAPCCRRRSPLRNRAPTCTSRSTRKPARPRMSRGPPEYASWDRASRITMHQGTYAARWQQRTRLQRLPRSRPHLPHTESVVISTEPTSPLAATRKPSPASRAIRPMPNQEAPLFLRSRPECHDRRSDTARWPRPASGTLLYTSLPGFPGRLLLDKNERTLLGAPSHQTTPCRVD
jgi:hypothetical protein